MLDQETLKYCKASDYVRGNTGETEDIGFGGTNCGTRGQGTGVKVGLADWACSYSLLYSYHSYRREKCYFRAIAISHDDKT